MNLRIVIAITFFVLFSISQAVAEVPQMINFQGHMTDGDGQPLDTTVSMIFTIYDDSTGGNTKWTDTYPSVTVSGGAFRVNLGEDLPIDDSVFNMQDRFLGITIGGDPEITPRTRLVSTPYAFRVSTVDGSTGGIISGDVSIQSDGRGPGDLEVAGKATIGPGHTNTGSYAFVAGSNSTAGGDYSTVGGGFEGEASGNFSTVSGGYLDTAKSIYSAIGGGLDNVTGYFHEDTAAYVGGGRNNEAYRKYSTIGGGRENTISGAYSTISGGRENTTSRAYSTISGGYSNTASGDTSTVSGGYSNTTSSKYSTIGGGRLNTADGSSSTIGGGRENTTSGAYSTISGGYSNTTIMDPDCSNATIGGGKDNTVRGSAPTVGGGSLNSANTYGTVSGGRQNTASYTAATVGGGYMNEASGYYSTISGGQLNTASTDNSTICGGIGNTASGVYSTVGGGSVNTASGEYSSIIGGKNNSAEADYSQAFGLNVRIEQAYCFGLYEGANYGKLRLNRDSDNGTSTYTIHVGTNTNNGNGAHLSKGGVWVDGSGTSDRGSTEQIDGMGLLEDISNMPIMAWNYIGTDERHIGPVAEDFVAAFDVGTTRVNGERENHHLAANDVAGVALIGVQELYRMVKQQQQLAQELKTKSQRIEQLETQMAELQTMMEIVMAQQNGISPELAQNK